MRQELDGARLLCRAAALALVVLAAGCGGDRDGKPSRDDLAAGLEAPDSILGTPVAPQITDCLADALLDSDLSSELLVALAGADGTYSPSGSEQEDLEGVLAEAISDCMDDLISES